MRRGPHGQQLDAAATEGLDQYFQLVASRHLKDRRKRESFAVYAYGILGESERKSVEPIAAQACGDPAMKFYLSSLPRRLSHKQIVRIIKERWRTERMYEDLKGELGLDHFEGRSFPGWHHHVWSVVLCCYAFVVAEKVRAFPPSTRRQTLDSTLSIAA